jgi:hypothetical protein
MRALRELGTRLFADRSGFPRVEGLMAPGQLAQPSIVMMTRRSGPALRSSDLFPQSESGRAWAVIPREDDGLRRSVVDSVLDFGRDLDSILAEVRFHVLEPPLPASGGILGGSN